MIWRQSQRLCLRLTAVLLPGLVLCLLLAACGQEKQEQAAVKIPVTAGRAVAKDMPREFAANGTVEAMETVNIVSRVSGQIQKIYFTEGQDVQAGELLLTIDAAAFKQELRQAEAKLMKETEQLNYNAVDLRRHQDLLLQGAIAKSDYDKVQTNSATQDAVVSDNQAAVDNARIKLQYCSITAPLAGKTGSRLVKQGDVVLADTTKLLTINQISPIYVSFAVPEKILPELKKYSLDMLQVKAGPPGFTEAWLEGKIAFIDNAVDTATGMLKLKAVFPNEDYSLWPGQYVNVTVILQVEPGVTVVPAAAVELGQDGHYLYVIKDDLTVELRPVQVDRTVGGESVITQGINPGETVVIDGQMNLKSGAAVEYKFNSQP